MCSTFLSAKCRCSSALEPLMKEAFLNIISSRIEKGEESQGFTD